MCQLSIQSIQYSNNQFLSSLLISNDLLSKARFDRQIDVILTQTQTSAPALLTHLLFLIRSTSHANAIVTTYGTNYEYFKSPSTWFVHRLHSRALVFENNCSCGMNASCTIPASFTPNNSSAERVTLSGLKMGCTPTESFLASTLECFYNSSCLNIMMQMLRNTNDRHSVIPLVPLRTNHSRFSIDEKVSNLFNNLFIERWSIVKNYSSYYHRCLPMQCSYTYYQKLDSLYTITYLLSLYGGLTIIFKWICPRGLYVLVKLFQCYKRRSTSVKPITSAPVAVIDTEHENIA